MSTEQLVRGLGEQLGRRQFFGKLGAAAVGGALLLLGFPRDAVAGHCQPGYVHFYCCCLCRQPSWSCSSQSCDCTWCWACCTGGRNYHCCECYNQYGACNSTCGSGQTCSYVVDGGPC